MSTHTFMYSRGTREAVIDALDQSRKLLTIVHRYLSDSQQVEAAYQCRVVTDHVTYALERMDLDEHVLASLPTTTPGGAA